MSCSNNNNSNFQYACKFIEQECSNDELWDYLEHGTNLDKQIACVKIDKLENDFQARILVENLTGVDGKIREVVSAKFAYFSSLPNIANLFLNKNFYPIFLDAIIDINGNICKNVINGLKNLTYNENFNNYMIQEIFVRAFEICKKIKSFDIQTRKYIMNKEVFKLYWYLYTLNIFPKLPLDKLRNLLGIVCSIEDFTVREKAARLLSKMPEEDQKIFDKLNFDKNFYVEKAYQSN